MGYILSVLSDKGGSGKTTISTNLAVGLVMRKMKVLLADADPQRSSSDWHASNDASLVNCLAFDRPTLAQDILSLIDTYDVIIIDGPPRLDKLSTAAIRISDAVLIPIQPSPYDVLAAAEIVELLKARQALTEDFSPQAAFVLSRVIKNTLLAKDVHEPLKQYGFPVLEGRTSQNVLYPTSASKGQSVFCTGENQTAHEFNKLIEEVIARYISRKTLCH
jgi:chromosome partitioning protein